MPDKTWKSAERRVAKLVGAERVGPRGDTSFDVVAGPEWDVGACQLGIEVKYRQKIADYLHSYLEQAEEHRENTLPMSDPVVVLVEKGMRGPDFMCLLRFRDYLKLRNCSSFFAGAQRTGDEVV